jgi:hypothetical protein
MYLLDNIITNLFAMAIGNFNSTTVILDLDYFVDN